MEELVAVILIIFVITTYIATEVKLSKRKQLDDELYNDIYSREMEKVRQMKNYQNFVDSIPQKEKIQIIDEYKQFQKDGFIGDSLLRTKAREYCQFLGIPYNPAFLNILAQEIALEFTFNYIREKYKQ